MESLYFQHCNSSCSYLFVYSGYLVLQGLSLTQATHFWAHLSFLSPLITNNFNKQEGEEGGKR